MFLNDMKMTKESVRKLDKILAETFGTKLKLEQMNTESLNIMLQVTRNKKNSIKESDLAYWENPRYNKLNLIEHQLRTYINEIAPARSDGKKRRSRKVNEQAEMETAEVLLAVQELVDTLQGMAEDVAKMQVQDLMPIVDQMKDQLGFDVAERFNTEVDASLGSLLDQVKQAKNSMENALLAVQGKPVNQQTDMAVADPAAQAQPMPADNMADYDEFAGDDAAAGPDNTVGRDLKAESKLERMEKDALGELRILEAKRQVIESAKNSKISTNQLKKIISSHR